MGNSSPNQKRNINGTRMNNDISPTNRKRFPILYSFGDIHTNPHNRANSPKQRLIPIEVADGRLLDKRMEEVMDRRAAITEISEYFLSIFRRSAEVAILRKRE